MSIAVRVDVEGTLGHLARVRHIARELALLGHRIVYAFDRSAPTVPSGWLDGHECRALYDEASVPSADELDETVDADRLLATLADSRPTFVILDDYRLGEIWEARIESQGIPVLALDDLHRAHAASLLLEPGLEQRPLNGRAPRALHLAGPRFLPLDPTLTPRSGVAPDAVAKTILLSLGGGGDLALLAAIAQALLEPSRSRVAAGAPARTTVQLHAVIGPQACNAEPLEALARRHPDRLHPIEGASSLAPHWNCADLYIGAAGTALYEAAVAEVPAITFSLAENQRNDRATLERIGHPLHLNADEFDAQRDAATLAELALSLLGQPARLRALRRTGDERPDTSGARRVASVIHAWSCGGHGEATRAIRTLGAAFTRAARDRTAPLDVEASSRTASGIEVRDCRDADINRYLDARNGTANRGNMTSDVPIPRLAHYRWWFTSWRRSSLLSHDGVAQLWIWHERRATRCGDALIGGWFVCRDRPDLGCVLAALERQLAETDVSDPDVPWAAIIRRGNDFVRAMNLRAGFRDARPGSDEERRVAECFPDAPPALFHRMVRDPVAPREGLPGPGSVMSAAGTPDVHGAAATDVKGTAILRR